jgi:hypothetical protein
MEGEAVALAHLQLVVDAVVLGLLVLQGLVVVFLCPEYIAHVLHKGHNALCLQHIGKEVMRNEDIESALAEWANVHLNDLVVCV